MMDKITALKLHASLSSSFSIHSLAEGSEIISEAEELFEMRHLQEKGDQAYKNKHYKEALQNYSDALDIDERNIDALAARAATYIDMEIFTMAQQDVEKLLSLNSKHPQGHYLLGVTMEHLGQYHRSLKSFLAALSLDYESEHADMLANNVCSMSFHFCFMTEKLLRSIPDMDTYTKLSEVGAALCSSKQYDLCIEVLNIAQKVATNQKGITMKVQLTLANAHSAVGDFNPAVSLYQDCLSTSLAAHDTMYQTKALVSIASLFLEAGDTYQAIIYYEKLLDLEQELTGADPKAQLPNYWSKDLQCALHLNLSIAYKSVSYMNRALYHALKYSRIVGANSRRQFEEAHSHHNVGMLQEVLGDQQWALESYKNFHSLSKKKGDKKGIAQSYGCLGSVYASLGNHAMAITYHEQHVSATKKLEDVKLQIQALEQMGDSLMKINRPLKACDVYNKMYKLCPQNDYHTKSAALLKLGNSYKAQGKKQYALHYIEEAKSIAQQNNFANIEIMSTLKMATILQHSSQVFELDQAKNYFQDLIPVLEAKIQQHKNEETFCSEELHKQLEESYDGIQNVLIKLGTHKECLIYAEASHLNSNHVIRPKSLIPDSLDRIIGIVHQQNATVLYYTVLDNALLLWVLEPGIGIARFYAGKNSVIDKTMPRQIEDIVHAIRSSSSENETKQSFDYENRSLPGKNSDVDIIVRNNKKLLGETKVDNNELADNTISKENKTTEAEKYQRQEKSPQRKLFDLLLAPVDDFLSKLEEQAPLVIVLDKVLSGCPIWTAIDWDNKPLSDYFRITVIPSLSILDRVSRSELDQLKIQDDVEFERCQSRLGGMPKIISARDEETSDAQLYPIKESVSTTEEIDLKKTSNPRLVTSGVFRSNPDGALLDSDPNGSVGDKSMPVTPKYIPELIPSKTKPLKSTKTVGSPTSITKLAGVHSFSTLTTKTSTFTDITSSHNRVPEFQQISDPYKCSVFGNPSLPKRLCLYNGFWETTGELKQAQVECLQVADVLNTTAIMGGEATKHRLLCELRNATVLHIATYGCTKKGLLVCAPNPDRHEDPDVPPLETSYLVTREDIINCTSQARLVVLSSWHGSMEINQTNNYSFALTSALLASGVQCVLTLLWPVPDVFLHKFYYLFYTNLHNGLMATQALKAACEELGRDDRINGHSHTSAFVLIGKDVDVKLLDIMSAQLDQNIDEAEKDVIEKHNVDPLNIQDEMLDVSDKVQNLKVVQECIGMILVSRQRDVISELIYLIDGALKRLHLIEHKQRTTILPENVVKNKGALKLLKLLQFHFQATGANIVDDPYVVFPHWNMDQLLMPVYDGLRSLEDILTDLPFARTLWEMLPTSQENISNLVDVLCVTKHSPEIQLKVSDTAVMSLMKDVKVKHLMTAMGFQQVGVILTFNNTPSNRRLLIASLQLFIALSTHKSPALLHKLDVSLLGDQNSDKASNLNENYEQMKLPSLTPLILPRNQLRMSTPWLSVAERPDEMFEKLKLAKSKETVGKEFVGYLTRAKTWHQSTLSGQAEDTLFEVGRPATTPIKIKVLPGATASFNRTPVSRRIALSSPQIDQRRDYANYVLQQRLDNVGVKHRTDVRKLYFPYIQNAK